MKDEELKQLESELEVLREKLRQTTDLQEFRSTFSEINCIKKKLIPYVCPHCFKVVYSNEDFIVREFMGIPTRIHKDCQRKMDEMRKRAKEVGREWKEKAKRTRYEIEHSIRKAYWDIWYPVYGYKKDFERLMSDIPKIVKKYNLVPPKVKYEKGEKIYVHERS